MTNIEYNKELTKIYEDRQRKIDEIFMMYSKGEINEQEKESYLCRNDYESKLKIIKLEEKYYFSNKIY